ncbi:LysR family transcriptional regulator [Bordetella bronchiseptica]|uniref:LysR-family transcriptional regulator n=1 Tax=Bordetella bronchiseptica (strain ATCC BAA-588 / NCTC 13252 / RB50) TaxID=257310 RepID=A0A0H3LMZ7_BORBR|nr:LysR family transcriptional regulator [Bordetella bronchiseptica]KAK69322.1 LysR substrate-binding domain protein [Bordetella bronchiseptica 980-2]KDD53195.1 LysR substrate-binding domain protein [Bordetella bronchiseptica OSU553]AMG88968.1 LysR family transcriptional regulator [Bordetella bronchiseptica]KCV47163.1 LysR substrate-binding domain protein [Bordetella bronchiseptica 3E44]KCV60389.1 LysR substrate-binding domain protein [Bordetella bronchiseptica 980]
MEPNRFGDILAFVSAVKAGSFTSAAATLGVTRSAVGKSVARLEARLGVRLLHRTTRKLNVTGEGLVVFERWSQILEDLEEVDATMAQRRGKPAGILRLTAPLSFGQRHILPILNAYVTNWPEIQADVWFTDHYVDLIEEGIDVAVRIGGVKDDARILSRTIGGQQFVTCAAPGYLAKKGVPSTPADLAGHDTIFFLSGQRPMPWRLGQGDAIEVCDGPGRMNIDSSEALREAALSGFGLIHLPTYITGKDLQRGDLVEVLEAYRPPADPIRLIYPSKRHLSPRTRAFIDLLIERWRDGVPWERLEPAS